MFFSKKCLFKSIKAACSVMLLTLYQLLYRKQRQLFGVFVLLCCQQHNWLIGRIPSLEEQTVALARARTHTLDNDLCSCTCTCTGGEKSGLWFPQLHQPVYISLQRQSFINKVHIVCLSADLFYQQLNS